ncbi:MAG: alpha/beta hydrolase [Mobilicoccus sp.]|nr:alpha/beta hydrolase [Mobilicoccus sp.]
MHRSVRTAVTVALVAPLVIATAHGAQATTPIDPPPAPGLPAEINDQVRAAAGTTSVAPRRTTRPWTMTQYRAQKVAWSEKNCTESTALTATLVGEKVECATVRTPLAWRDLSKGSMDLHISRVAATGRGARTLFVNPGGPGGAAGPMTLSVAALKPALKSTHHIVGVDPRGTGGSTPLECMPETLGVADSRDLSTTTRNASRASMKAFVDACVKKHGRYLQHITTYDTVSDHDLVRQLLVGRTTKVDWFGVSGGSWMGAWYAQYYPHSLERVVLDANTEFTTDWRSSFAGFPMGFQRRFEGQFLPWMGRQHATFGGGSTVTQTRRAYERVRAAAAAGRVTGLRADDVDGILMLLMYEDATLPYAAQFIAGTDAALRASSGAVEPALPEELLASLGGGDPSFLTVRTAIICNDTAFDRRTSSLEREFRENIRRFPLAAGGHDLVIGPCASWPYKPQPAPRIGTRGPMKLMVQTQYDPATPIEGARRAHRADPRTRLLTVEGQGSHGAYLTENACVDKVVTNYLTKGTMPRRDTSCAGVPLPNETKVMPVTWTPRR